MKVKLFIEKGKPGKTQKIQSEIIIVLSEEYRYKLSRTKLEKLTGINHNQIKRFEYMPKEK